MENKVLTYGLILQVTVLSYLLLKAEKKVSYYEGQQAGVTVTVTETDGMMSGPYTSPHKKK